MRDELFAYFVELGHDLCYKRAYLISARRISNAYSGFLMLASAGGIVTLACWDAYPVIWAIIAVVAQILQVLKPLTQSSRQRDALKYIIQDTDVLLDEVCTYWNTVGAYDVDPDTELEIAKKITYFKSMQRESKNRFAADLDFPFKKRLDEKAMVENAKFFWYHYNIRIKEEF